MVTGTVQSKENMSESYVRGPHVQYFFRAVIIAMIITALLISVSVWLVKLIIA